MASSFQPLLDQPTKLEAKKIEVEYLSIPSAIARSNNICHSTGMKVNFIRRICESITEDKKW
jgi:hypothetical protein